MVVFQALPAADRICLVGKVALPITKELAVALDFTHEPLLPRQERREPGTPC